MSAAEFEARVDAGRLGRFSVDATYCAEVWVSWSQTGARMSGFLPVAKARELAAALTAAADATDEATRAAESAVKL